MSSTASKTMVGAFVLGGIALFATGIIFLGGAKMFGDALKYVLYFDGSVSGLSIGAPVVFRGVPMGNVTQISLVANSRDSNVTIPVTIMIDERSFISSSGNTLSERMQSQIIRRMVERGLRARLALGSLITGQSRVELDFFPNTPMIYRSSDPDSEIPTIPSPIDTLQKTLAKLPIEKVADSLSTILSSITDAVGDGKLETGIQAFAGAFDELKSLLAQGQVRDALANMMGELANTSKAVGADLPRAISSFIGAMDSITKAATAINRISVTANGTIEPDSPTMNDLRRLLKEATAAARSLRNFADLLERNPEALLMGKQGRR